MTGPYHEDHIISVENSPDVSKCVNVSRESIPLIGLRLYRSQRVISLTDLHCTHYVQLDLMNCSKISIDDLTHKNDSI